MTPFGELGGSHCKEMVDTVTSTDMRLSGCDDTERGGGAYCNCKYAQYVCTYVYVQYIHTVESHYNESQATLKILHYIRNSL